MKKFSETVNRLQQITQTINEENCWSKVIEFFSLTSYLYDNIEEIRLIPLKGRETRTVWGYTKHHINRFFKKLVGKAHKDDAPYRSPEEMRSLELREKFITEVNKSGRDECGINRTKKGEEVTEDKVFFGNIYGLWTFNVREWSRTTDKSAKDLVAKQVISFVRSYRNSFKTDWAEAA